MQPWRVTLDETERAACVRAHNKITPRVKRYGPNYTGLHHPRRFFIGKAGEIALVRWLRAMGRAYIETTNEEGVPDRQDVLVLVVLNRHGETIPPTLQRINVKNTLHPNARFLMQPVSQQDRHKQDIYVGGKGVDNGVTIEMELHGAIARDEFLRKARITMRDVETRELLLAELPRSMDYLATALAPHTPENCLMVRRHHHETEKTPLQLCPYAACP